MKALGNCSPGVIWGRFVIHCEPVIWPSEIRSSVQSPLYRTSLRHSEMIPCSFISLTLDYQTISCGTRLENVMLFVSLFSSSVNCWSLPEFTVTANHAIFKIIHINNMNLKALSYLSWQVQTADSHTFLCWVCLTSYRSLIVSFQNKDWNWKARGESAKGEMKVSIYVTIYRNLKLPLNHTQAMT